MQTTIYARAKNARKRYKWDKDPSKNYRVSSHVRKKDAEKLKGKLGSVAGVTEVRIFETFTGTYGGPRGWKVEGDYNPHLLQQIVTSKGYAVTKTIIRRLENGKIY